MIPQKITPVKLFMGVLYSRTQLFEKGIKLLESIYGPIDYISGEYKFDVSDYYVPEMGSPIQRRFFSFNHLINPQKIAAIKLETNAIEEALSIQSQRKVNFDPGYMDFDKIVLASAKYNGQKIYMDHGIWADLTLRFEKGHYYPYPWSFPDFKSGIYTALFLEMRSIYKRNLRNLTQHTEKS